MSDLSDREVALLDVAGQWFRSPSVQATLIQERLGVSMTRFYQELYALIETERAEAYAPVTVHRLRRERDRRREARSTRHLRVV